MKKFFFIFLTFISSAWAGDHYIFYLNFDQYLLYTDNVAKRIKDARIEVERKIAELSKSCNDCAITIIRTDRRFIPVTRPEGRQGRVKKRVEVKFLKGGKTLSQRYYRTKNMAKDRIVSLIKNVGDQKYLYFFGHTIQSKGERAEQGLIDMGRVLKQVDIKLNAIVLSSCGNGSLATLRSLSPYANYMVAAPSDIHLSMLKVSELSEASLPEYLTQSFDFQVEINLSETSLSLYDLNRFQNLSSLTDEELFERRDEFTIKNLYQPRRFGKSKLVSKELVF